MADKPKVKPGTAGIWIGILLMVLGLGSCIGGPVWGIWGLVGQVQDIVDSNDGRVAVPAAQTYTFEDGASGIIVGLGDSQADASSVQATLEGPNGVITLNDGESYSSSGDLNGTFYELVAGFDDTTAGTYTLTATGNAGAEVAIVPLSVGTVGSRVLGGLAIGAVLGLIGLILMIVTIVRRSKAKKRAAASGFGGPGGYPAAAPGGYPPAPGMAPPAPGGYPPAPGMAPPAPADPYAPPPPVSEPPAWSPPPAPPAPSQTPPPPPPPPFS